MPQVARATKRNFVKVPRTRKSICDLRLLVTVQNFLCTLQTYEASISNLWFHYQHYSIPIQYQPPPHPMTFIFPNMTLHLIRRTLVFNVHILIAIILPLRIPIWSVTKSKNIPSCQTSHHQASLQYNMIFLMLLNQHKLLPRPNPLDLLVHPAINLTVGSRT